jgi:diadenosine tetraphosphate (Ap4A) HIT family hydrolase
VSQRETTTKCKTCERVRRRDVGRSPPWDAIYRSVRWDVVHADRTTVEGWTVLVVRRHITAVADLTDGEAFELGRLIRDVSLGIQAIVHCNKTYVAQFAEHPQHPHVHVHLIPRCPSLPEHLQGPEVFRLIGVPQDASVPEGAMNEFAMRLRGQLEAIPGTR